MNPNEVTVFICGNDCYDGYHLTLDEAEKCRGDIQQVVYYKCAVCGQLSCFQAGAETCCTVGEDLRTEGEKMYDTKLAAIAREICKAMLYGENNDDE